MKLNPSTALLLAGCLCLVATAISGESTADSSDLKAVTESDNSTTTTTTTSSNKLNETELSTGQEHGPKSKVKEVVDKVKNKIKEIGTGSGGNWRYRNGYKKTTNGGSSNYDTSTVLWIVFGTIGGSVLIIAVYFGFRAYNKQ